MAVETKKVNNRRKLRFETYDDLIADASTLSTYGYQKLGNWSLAQMLDHLTKLHVGSIEGGIPDGPLPFRIISQWVLKKHVPQQRAASRCNPSGCFARNRWPLE